MFFAGNAANATSSNELFRIRGNGNIGIGRSNPNAPLQFANDLRSRKIVLYEGTNNDHQFYGLGINNGIFRYQLDALTASHVFYAAAGSSASNELFRISGGGNVGIGQSNPTAPLQFATDTRNRKVVLWSVMDNDHQFYGFGVNGFTLRYQTPATTDDHVFYAGTGTNTSNELFRIKGNGALGINGNTGQPGQVLRSNGNNAAATWMDMPSSQYDRTIQINGDGNTLTNGPGQIPGLSYAFTLAGNAKVLVQFNVTARALPCAFCGKSKASVQIFLNGTRQGVFINEFNNDYRVMISGSQLLQLGAGTHTLIILAIGWGDGDVVFGGVETINNMIVQIIPQ